MTRGSITSGGLQPLNGGKIGNTPAMKITDIKTFLVGAAVPADSEDALLIAQSGRTSRVTAGDLALVARDRKGTVGINLEAGDSVARIVVLPSLSVVPDPMVARSRSAFESSVPFVEP